MRGLVVVKAVVKRWVWQHENGHAHVGDCGCVRVEAYRGVNVNELVECARGDGDADVTDGCGKVVAVFAGKHFVARLESFGDGA